MERELQVLLKSQVEISNQIAKLVENSNNIIMEIETIVEGRKSDRGWLKEKLKTNLINRGYNVNSGKAVRTKVQKAEKGTKILNIDYRVSKFSVGSCNAWYTLNNDSMEVVDFYALGYMDKKGVRSVAIVPKSVMMIICESIKVTHNGGVNIKLIGDSKVLQEMNSKVELTKYINNFEIIN